MKRTLYKYFPLQNIEHLTRIKNLLEGTIYFSSPINFNDPFEMAPPLAPPHAEDFTRYVEQHHLDLTGVSKSAVNKLYKTVVECIRIKRHPAVTSEWLTTLGVLCLTTNHCNLLMWAHYASNHSGVCIGFDSAAQPFSSASPVTYSGERPRIRPLEFWNDDRSLIDRVLYHKSSHWEYEQEWRCVKRSTSENERAYYLDLYKSDNTREDEIAEILASEDGPGSYHFCPHRIRRIYFGAKIDPDFRNEIECFVQQHKLQARSYQMQIDPLYFRLNETSLKNLESGWKSDRNRK